MQVHPGETLGVVGESGCGKSVTAFSVLRLLPRRTSRIVSGRILFDRRDGSAPVDMAGLDANGELIRDIRGNEIAMIFQDPFSSLNPRMTVSEIVAEPLVIHRVASGAALKRKVQELLEDLQEELGLTYLFIAHDLSVVEHISDRVAVMYLGKIVEMAEARELFESPRHPYTEALLSAIPIADPDHRKERIVLAGDVPSPSAPPPGCKFHPRCRYAQPLCSQEEPPLTPLPGRPRGGLPLRRGAGPGRRRLGRRRIAAGTSGRLTLRSHPGYTLLFVVCTL